MKRGGMFGVVVVLAIGLSLVCSGCPTGRQGVVATASDSVVIEKSSDTVRLFFVGDIMAHDLNIKAGWGDGGDSCYNFVPPYEHIRSYISGFDLAVANLEVTLGGAPYKGYPAFSSPDAMAEGLKEVGFDVLLLANNHILDRGKNGLERTLRVLEGIGMPSMGAYSTEEDKEGRYPYIHQVDSLRIGFVNYTYGTNGLTVTKPNVVNYIDTAAMRMDIKKAREKGADFVVACVHWGLEYKTVHNAEQTRLAKHLVKCGADLIVGAHPHVVQPIEWISRAEGDSVACAYSLGSFISNIRRRYTNGSIGMEVDVERSPEGVVRVVGLRYRKFYIHRYGVGSEVRYRIIDTEDYEAHPEKYPTVVGEEKRWLLEFSKDTDGIVGQQVAF